MKKIRMFLLIIAAMLAVQMYEPAAVCEVQAATKTTIILEETDMLTEEAVM